MTQFFKLVAELGLPIAATVGMGMFILFIIKYILNGIVNSIKFIESVISQLDNRVKTMNNDILKIDQEVSEQLGLPIDTDRVARADGEIHALYDPSTDTIYLKDTFNMFNVFDKGVLMHELMHYVHDLNDAVGTKFDCMAQSEAEIYPLQKKYLLDVHGVNWEYDSMYLKVISSCN